MARTTNSGPINSEQGFEVNGVTVIDSSGNLTATAGSVGTAEIADSAITAGKIASDAVTTVKILDSNVTAGKLASDAVTTVKILDSNVTTAKIADAAVTTAKLAETTIQYAEVELTATEIVGTSAGDLGHAAGAVLVAAPGATKTLEFVSAVLIYDYDTAAYTGGGDDLVVRQGTTTVSAAVAGADLVGASADKIAFVGALSAADIALTANSTLNLASTAWTQPGTAAGVLRVKVAYRVHTTGL